ncbi:MAG: oxidoreductase [Chloroflexota bacterium]|nr:MAG: oxidoreductase [Chloroflexota bacterium]HDD60944.1 oxidoreductase [Chloroflexota bacterium]
MGAKEKPKLAMYWAAACGGCEISVLNIHEHILTVDEVFDIAFFPCIADFKVKDVEGYPDGYIDVCLFNGAIRNSENEEMAHLLRKKSKIMVAYGSCAYEGCIPALSNLTTKEATFDKVYINNPSIDNPDKIFPQEVTKVPEGELTLPVFYNTVKSLDQVIDVDYYLPGCPPEPPQIWAVLQVVVGALLEGAPLPPAGAIIGAGTAAVCDECEREKSEKCISQFYRPYEIIPDPDQCLLEQGLICMGIATRSGCGALCPSVGIGCRGCYGPPEGVIDQGGKMLSAIASVIDAGDETMEEAELEHKIQEVIDTIADPAGTFYRFSMAHSILRRVKNGKGDK